jgi:hypothetical protein
MRRVVVSYLFCLGLFCGTLVLSGQQPVTKLSTGEEVRLSSLVFEGNQFVFQGHIDHLLLYRTHADSGFVSLELPGFFLTGRHGSPALPQKSLLFEAARGEVARIHLEHLDSMVFDLQQMGIAEKIAPFRPSAQKGRAIPDTWIDSMDYDKDVWMGEPVVAIEYEGTMRGLPMSTLHFNPVKYNPARNMVKVYFNLKCTIETTGLERRSHISSEAFSGLFKRVVRQSNIAVRKAIMVEEPMTLVILSDTIFRETLQPFIEWKTVKGFNVVEAYRNDPEVGSTRESIKSYLENLYAQPVEDVAPPSYLLIVGDVEHIPLSQSGGQVTDLYYATFDGEDDYIPDLFYGRISVASKEQLRGVLNKVLEYEQYQFPDPSFLDESVLIAGVDGTFASRHGNGQINYAHDYYFNESNGINAHTFLYPGSDTSDSQILDLISGGVGFVNYTGHGLYDRWINPTFHQNDIENLQNHGKYPVMVGNGCETNVFNLGECFAEALLRAPEKGALAYIGCTNDSYWDEDYFWAVGLGPIVAQPLFEESAPGYFDKVFHSHGEPFALWTPSLGEMIFGGNMAVQQSNSPRKKFYWEIYQLAGDPTIVPWFSQPGAREVKYPEVLPAGSSRLDVTCAPYDYVALTQEGVLLDAIHASEQGHATLYFPQTVQNGTLDLVISGDLYTPYVGEVTVGVPPGPYLDLAGYELSDESVEKDGLISLNEQFSMHMQWINRGASDAPNDTLVLFTDQEGIILQDSLVILENLEAGDTLMMEDAFRIASGVQLSDQEPVILGMYWKGDGEGRRIYLQEKMHAPVLMSGGITWDDRPSGNGNGIAEPGEWLVCKWSIGNRGHFRTGNVTGRELRNEVSIFKQFDFGAFLLLEPGDSTLLAFSVQVADSVHGSILAGPFAAGDQHVTILDSFLLYTGRHFEDFSGGITDHYPFMSTSASPWMSDTKTYASSGYSLRSGAIPNYGASDLSVSFKTTIEDTFSFAYRVSSEAGYDFLNFYVDSILIQRWSGEREWNQYSVVLEPGFHEMTWVYGKDMSMSRGEDAAWIDDLVFPASAFRSSDLALTRIIQPVTGPWLTHQEEVRLKVRNTGTDTIQGFTTSVTVDHYPISIDTSFTPILPGTEKEFSVSETFDLSAFGIHTLQIEIVAEQDVYKGNNHLEMEMDHYIYPDLALMMVQLEAEDGIRSEAIIAIGNEGNISVDSLRFEVWLDDTLSKSGVRFIGLEPGVSVLDTFMLVDSSEIQLTTGFYEYLVKSVAVDSLKTNNEVHGILYWHSLSTSPSDPPKGLLLYPNPATEGFNLWLPRPVDRTMKIELVNIQGRVETSHAVEKGTQHLFIPVESLAPGNYMMNINGLNVVIPVVIAD